MKQDVDYHAEEEETRASEHKASCSVYAHKECCIQETETV